MKNWYAVEVCGILLLTLVSVWIRNGTECLTFDCRLSRCESLWSLLSFPFGSEWRRWHGAKSMGGRFGSVDGVG